MSRRGYPYREKKKARSKFPEDKRPHTGYNPYTRWIRAHEEPDNHTYVPDIKIQPRKGNEWGRNEVHQLFEIYSDVSWGRKSQKYRDLVKLDTHFMKLWKAQKGCCAMSGAPLLGAAGIGGQGIGIDIINHSMPIRKGNIRIVSAPLALTRYRCENYRTQDIKQLDPNHYQHLPVYFAILKHIQWYFQEKRPFKNLPIVVEFPEPSKSHQSRIGSSILCKTGFLDPKGYKLDQWTNPIITLETPRICDIFLVDDVLVTALNTFRINEPSWFVPAGRRLEDTNYRISLGDPTIQIEKYVANIILMAFQNYLHNRMLVLGKDW